MKISNKKITIFLLIICISAFAFDSFAATANVSFITPADKSIAVHPVQINVIFNINRVQLSFPWDNGRITSRFGYRTPPKEGASSYHRGIDVDGSLNGQQVRASMGGIAYFKVDSNDPEAKTGFGYYIIIDHGGDLYTIYAHLQKHENWQPRRVNLGDIIGKVDNSGNSTGPHLHFEVREGSDKGKYAVNPGDFLDPEHISNYISSRGAISRIRVSTFIDGNELDGSFKTIPQGIVRNISYDSIWDLAQTQAMAGDHTITVRVFDGAFGGVGGTAIGDTNVNVKVEPPKIWNEKPTGEITEKRPTISAIITSPSNIPIKVSSIIITLNGIEITSTFSPNENAPEIQISYTPISDLSSGTHTVTVNGSDVNENAASFSWNFNEDRSAGKYTVDWFGDNQNSEKVASGVYLYVLKTAKEIAVQKIMVIR